MCKVIFRKIEIFIICTYILLSSAILPDCFAGPSEAADEAKKLKADISIRAATPIEEFGIIFYTLRNMAFFRMHGYDVSLPNHVRFKQLLESSVDISKVDKKELYELFVGEIYDQCKYKKGLNRIGYAEEIVVKAFPIFEKFKRNWDFRTQNSYDVILTLYGPGGQYNPKTGKIFIKTTTNGQFKRIDPVHTIIHEMVHIGIDKNIVKQYHLTHWEKERVVDLICSLFFSDILINYKLQSKGAKSIDAYVTNDSIKNLPLAIKTYAKQKGDVRKNFVDIIIVDKVFIGSQAENVGLQKGDILFEYDGEKITIPSKLVEAVKNKVKKKKIELVIIRGSQIERFVIKGGSIGIKIAKNSMLKKNLPKELQ